MQEAKGKIVKLHPLKAIPIGKVFPAFACCLRCKGSGKEEFKKIIIEENNKQNAALVSILSFLVSNSYSRV